MNVEGKILVKREELIMIMIAGMMVGAIVCRRLLGMGSSGHVVGGLPVRS